MQTIKLTPEELYDYLSNVDHSYSSVHEFLCEAIKLRNQDLVDKTIKLTENDCTFVHYVLRMYANQTPGLDSEDKEEIYEVAAKFK
jgi:hypothetical protein